MSNPDFIEAYLEWCGESECPTEYLKWSALSLLAAACGNRIFTTRNIGSHEVSIVPNLYIVLVGPSGNFKSFALSRIETVLRSTDYAQVINLYNGHVTAPAMYDAMKSTFWVTDKDGNRKKVEKPWRKQFYLLNDELANDVGSIDFADLFIKSLTRMYLGSPFDDRTRTSGHIHIENYSINWFAATTSEWLIKSISPDALLAGFLGRVVMVNQSYTGRRIWSTDSDPAWHRLFDYLTNRITELYDTSGCVPLSQHALRVAKSWYFSREEPDPNDHTMGSFRRQHDLSLKLALLLALSRHATEISDDMLVEAQDMTDQVVRWQREIVPDIVRGKRLTNEMRLLTFIRNRGSVKRHILAKHAYEKYNMKAGELTGLLGTWMNAKLIVEVPKPRNQGGTEYHATSK